VGSGGTLGGYMSREDMKGIDSGVPLLSMYSPYEMSSKVSFYRAMSASYAQP